MYIYSSIPPTARPTSYFPVRRVGGAWGQRKLYNAKIYAIFILFRLPMYTIRFWHRPGMYMHALFYSLYQNKNCDPSENFNEVSSSKVHITTLWVVYWLIKTWEYLFMGCIGICTIIKEFLHFINRAAYSSCCLECVHACTVTEGGRETMEREREKKKRRERGEGGGDQLITHYVT